MKLNFKAASAFVILSLLIVSSCSVKQNNEEIFKAQIQEIKTKFAPDKRVALFDIQVEKEEDVFILKGESDLPVAIDSLKKQLELLHVNYIDSIRLLPAKKLKGKTNAVINISVANLRSKPKHSAELATQATLGTPVKVLKQQEGWYLIQTPDKYLSWVDDGGITLMTDQRFKEWKEADKIMFTKTYGHTYNDITEQEIISDVVSGAIFEFVKLSDKHFIVSYPDGRIALMRFKEGENYFSWVQEVNPSPDNLVATSKKLMGVPYLWGGTSTKGMDCSGFTKTVYFLNGMVIPRDASQQVHTGKQIDENRNFENLEKGDLLFFGKKATENTKEKVVHVGMWIGNDEFIHASNMVRVSSINPDAENFDEYNLNRYLRSNRILKETDKDLIDLKQLSVFK